MILVSVLRSTGNHINFESALKLGCKCQFEFPSQTVTKPQNFVFAWAFQLNGIQVQHGRNLWNYGHLNR